MEVQNTADLSQSLPTAQIIPSGKGIENRENDRISAGKALSLCPDTKKIQKNKRRSKYRRIDDTIRQKLIDAVTKEGQMLKVVCNICLYSFLTCFLGLLNSIMSTTLPQSPFSIPSEKKEESIRRLCGNDMKKHLSAQPTKLYLVLLITVVCLLASSYKLMNHQN